MKICMPLENNAGMDSNVFGHFGSAPFFGVYDTEMSVLEVIGNDDAHHAHGMCQPLSMFANRKIDAVVCGGMGGRAIMKLNEAGIRAYRSTTGTITDVVREFAAGRLPEITPEGACGGHGCH